MTINQIFELEIDMLLKLTLENSLFIVTHNKYPIIK